VFRAGGQQSEALNGQPQVSTLPAAVPARIAQVPELLQIAKLGRAGGVNVRSQQTQPRLTSEQQTDVAAARDMYKKMRSQASSEDITPELYLYCVLQDYLLYSDMRTVVEDMAKRQPASPEVRELASWVRERTQ
jgi:hypothetical protein